MLKLQYLFENFDLAKECLALYDADEKNLDRMLSYFRISSNAVYPFHSRTTGRRCVLRLAPVEERKQADVVSVIRLIEWLIGQGVPAMKPYPMKDGRVYAEIETAWGRYHVTAYEQVAGETLEDCDGSLALVRGYGRTLGQLHAQLKRYPHAETRPDHAALMAEVRERFSAYHAPAAPIAEWEDVSRELQALPLSPDVYGVIHYDFEADNVMYDEETDTFGILDFDDAVRGWYALDVARALDCLDDVAEGEDPQEAKAAFLDGYREVTPFTAEQEATLPLMRRLVRLQEYGTILHVLSEPVEDEPDWMTDIREELGDRLRCIEELCRKR